MPPSGQHHVARRKRFMTTPNGRVMFIAAHPDDPDFLAGGTVARLAKEGRAVAYVILTNANKGSGDRSVASEQLAPIREEEQRRAAHVLGVEHVKFLGYEDGELDDTRDLRRDVTREIRRWRPDLIITLSPHRTYNNFPGGIATIGSLGAWFSTASTRSRETTSLFQNCRASTSRTAFARCTTASGSDRVSSSTSRRPWN